MDYDSVCSFRGKNVDEMTIEELREAVKFLGRAYTSVLQARTLEREMWREIKSQRQGPLEEGVRE